LLIILLGALPLVCPQRAAGGDTVSVPADPDTAGPVTPDSIRYRYPPTVVEAPRWNDLETHSEHFLTVLGPERLSSTAALDIGEVVGRSTGVVLRKTGGPGSQELVSIRGSTSQQVLVLLNGRRLNTAQGGGVDLSQFYPGDVTQVEIYPEGNDARWGSSSMGGILNIVTTGAARNGLHLRTLGGSYGTRSVALSAGGGGATRLKVSGSYDQGENNFDFTDPRRDNTRRRVNADFRSLSFLGTLSGAAGREGAFEFSLSASKDDRGAPGPIEFPTPDARLEDERVYLHGGLTGPAAGFDVTLGGGLHRLRRYYRNPDPILWADDRHYNTTLSADLDAERGFIGSTVLRTGAAVERDILRSTTDGSQGRNSFSLYTQTSVGLFGTGRGDDPAPVSVTPGVRFEKAGSFDPEVLPSLSVRAQLVEDLLVVRGSAGRKYRPPSFDELFWPISSGAQGNPDLLPERSTSTELSVTSYLYGKRVRMRGAAYRRNLTDLIEWTPGAGGIWRPHNVGEAREEGIEFEGAYRGRIFAGLPPVSALASHSIIEATVRGDDPLTRGRQLVRRPVSVSSLVLDVFPTNGLTVGIAWSLTGRRYLTQANTKWLDAYTVIDFNVKQEFRYGVTLLFSVKNLGGEHYYDVDDFPVPGRTFIAAFDFRISPTGNEDSQATGKNREGMLHGQL